MATHFLDRTEANPAVASAKLNADLRRFVAWTFPMYQSGLVVKGKAISEEEFYMRRGSMPIQITHTLGQYDMLAPLLPSHFVSPSYS